MTAYLWTIWNLYIAELSRLWSGFRNGWWEIQRTKEMHLLQAFSSLASEQSGLSSHIHVRGTHSPGIDRQENSSVLHTFCSEIQTITHEKTTSRTLINDCNTIVKTVVKIPDCF